MRFGSLTSPAVKVTLFHASAEKSELVCATQIADKKPERGQPPSRPLSDVLQSSREPSTDRRNWPAAISECHASPTMIPSTIKAISEPVLANVKDVLDQLAEL